MTESTTKSTTPWAVRTSKRKASASEPQPKKRQRLPSNDCHSGPRTLPKSRQQTLTQIQFAPYTPSLSSYDGTEAIETGADLKIRRRMRSNKSEEPIMLKLPKKQRSTLTQMDFLATGTTQDDIGDDFEERVLVNEIGNVTPATGRKAAPKAKRKSVQPREQFTNKTGMGGCKASGGNAAEGESWHGRTRRSTGRDGSHTKTLSEPRPSANPVSYTAPRNTRAATKAAMENQQAGPYKYSFLHNKENIRPVVRPLPGFAPPQTPKKRQRDVVPSSQSPESVSISSKKRLPFYREKSSMSPLKERSTNGTPLASTRRPRVAAYGPTRNAASPKRKVCVLKYAPARNASSPKRKVCVLKYGPGLLKKSDLAETDEAGVNRHRQSPRLPQDQQHPGERYTSNNIKAPGNDGSALDIAGARLGIEVPETGQRVQHELVPSSQTDSEGEVEIPETSQGLRRITSTPSLNRSDESLQMLSEANYAPITAKTPRSEEHVVQLEHSSLDTDVPDHDFGSVELDKERTPRSASTIRQNMDDAEIPAAGLSAQRARTHRAVLTINDSQDEDEDEEGNLDMGFVLRASTGNGVRFSGKPNTCDQSSPNATPRAPLPVSNALSSPTLPSAPHASYPPSTISRIPTKSSLLSSSSSPTILPPPKPATQQCIHPASMARPSQVSTQAVTQQSWLPASSPSIPNTTFSSPSNGPKTAHHVTIKETSSITPPLGEIPSQPQPQVIASALVDVGLVKEGDDDLDRDEDLDPKSSSPLPQPGVDDEIGGEDNHQHQYDNNPNDNCSQQAGPALHSTAMADSTESKQLDHGKHRLLESIPSLLDFNPPPTPAGGGGAAAQRPSRQRNPQPAPLPRLRLSESMLESLPGPPGWVAPPYSPSTSSLPSQGDCAEDVEWGEGSHGRKERRRGGWDDSMLL